MQPCLVVSGVVGAMLEFVTSGGERVSVAP